MRLYKWVAAAFDTATVLSAEVIDTASGVFSNQDGIIYTGQALQ